MKPVAIHKTTINDPSICMYGYILRCISRIEEEVIQKNLIESMPRFSKAATVLSFEGVITILIFAKKLFGNGIEKRDRK
jgi:hypothetical protein